MWLMLRDVRFHPRRGSSIERLGSLCVRACSAPRWEWNVVGLLVQRPRYLGVCACSKTIFNLPLALNAVKLAALHCSSHLRAELPRGFSVPTRRWCDVPGFASGFSPVAVFASNCHRGGTAWLGCAWHSSCPEAIALRYQC